MHLKPEEVSWAIQDELKKYKDALAFESVGRVLQVGDGIARVYGLDQVMMSELVEFPNGTLGIAMNLEADNIGVVLLGTEEGIKEEDVVKRTGKLVSVPVGEALLGRVVNALGQPIDGKGPILTENFQPIEGKTPNVVEREPVDEPLMTGIKAIDAMIPIGKGQRELILGDRQTGKTTIILDAIINQKGKDVHCIYVAIGQKASSIALTVKVLEAHGAMEHTTIVAATSSDAAAMQYLAPYTGATMGEHYMYHGKHAVCFYDDLSKHAQAYRQLSLLLRRPPGREAYPGDIFYQHSRLLERGARLSRKLGGGTMTAIPVIETLASDITTYIPTNVISITDGQIYLESDLFHAGIRPAVNVGLSISRVGTSAQTKAMKKVAKSLRLDLAQYREMAAFAQFGADIDDATKALLERGLRMTEVLKQEKYKPYTLAQEVVIIFIGTNGYLDDVPVDKIGQLENDFYHYLEHHHPQIIQKINESRELSDETANELKAAITQFKKKQ